MRFNSTATLIDAVVTLDSTGNPVEVIAESPVFVNKYVVGATAWFAAREAGLKADAEVSLRTCDYDGQERLLMDGIEYEVERVSDNGEFTRLTLANRLANG